MQLLKLIFVCLLVSVTVGCSSTKELFGIAADAQGAFFISPIDKDPNSVVIYVYRPKGYAYQPDVFINGVNKSLLGPGAYLQSVEKNEKIHIVVQANPNSGNWNFKPIGITINASRGERRYFRISAGLSSVIILPIAGAVGYTGGIEEVPEAIAIEEMKITKSMN